MRFLETLFGKRHPDTPIKEPVRLKMLDKDGNRYETRVTKTEFPYNMNAILRISPDGTEIQVTQDQVPKDVEIRIKIQASN